MNTPLVAIVIPLHNDALTIGACLRGVFEKTVYSSWRVIVVDDGSTDGGADIARTFPQVEVITQKRMGVAAAINAGIVAAGTDDIVRLHADVVIEQTDWLSKLVDAVYSKPKAGIVGVRLVFPDGRIYSEGRSIVAGLGISPQHASRRQFQPDGAPGKVQEVDSVSGALSYYRRTVIESIGGLDTAYGPTWMEDDDFCISARHAGFKVYVHAGVKAVHFTRGQPPVFRVLQPDCENEFVRVTGFLKNTANRAQADYWESKWGWNPVYPDMGEIRRLYLDTEICWQVGESLRFKPEDEFPSVDCCLVTCNTIGLLKRCLESLALTDYPADRINVYIADNASTDGTAEYLADLAATFPFALHHLKLTVNTGCPVGMNFAVTAGKGQLVARLDDDIVLPENWLKLMVEDLKARPFAGCIGPKILNDDEQRTIQCGPFRHYPAIFAHEDEVDNGQADYLARTGHVRGCCNLYRRDVFARAGLFDSRFSPTQFDDPDHHVALIHAGYEIIYDGRVAVVHKLNNGLGRTPAALSNQLANQKKMIGKWGADVWEIIERSLELSREGRYLPDGGDTRAWLALGPCPEWFPRRVEGSALRIGEVITPAYDDLVKAETRADFKAWIDEHIARAKILRASNSARVAIDVLHAMVCVAPSCAELLAELAEHYCDLGQAETGRSIARRGMLLAPDCPRLNALISTSTANKDAQLVPTMLQRVNMIGEASVQVGVPKIIRQRGEGLRVLMVNTFEVRSSGGDMHQVKKTRQYLADLGVDADICCTPRPDPRGYDVVHLWNTWFPAQTLAQVKSVRAWRPDMPIVHTTIFWDMREKCWADAAVPTIFSQATTVAQLDDKLAQVAAGSLTANGRTRLQPREANWRGYDAYQRAIFALVDHLLPQSQAELANLKKMHGIVKPATLVYNGAETSVFDASTPDWFVQNYGVKDFVLSVGLVEPRKNQLMLLHALRDAGRPIVIIGRHYDRSYYQLCRKFAPKGTIFIDHLPHEHLASAFKAAKVHALPSWMECASFANIEAALAGSALVVSDRTSEKEYFGDNAYYCDPANVLSIRTAVTKALAQHTADAPKRARLREQFRTRFTWENAAKATVQGYRAALALRGIRAAA